jgi:hypothetical protein
MCDGLDNDCDGQIDDSASCPAGQGCADGECVARCGTPANAACPADRLCREGLCRFAECVRVPCQPGFRCEPARGCVDRCEGVTCPGGTRCENGECTSCLVRGCGGAAPGASGAMVCRGETCVANPCAGQRCTDGKFCRDGACVAGCVGVTCSDGEVCRDGTCRADRCAGRSCPGGQYCDPNVGQCAVDPCATITCLPAQVCVAGTARCVDNPCQVTSCPGGQACRVRVDGQSECAVSREVAASGGCACVVGAAPAQASAAPGLIGVLALLGLLLRTGRRRGRRC